MSLIAFISGKGGEGKSSLAANTAAGLAREGKRVLVADLCYGMRMIDIYLGMENQVIYNISDVLDGKCDINQAAVSSRKYDNLYLLAAPLTKDISQMSDNIIAKLNEWTRQFDYVILDCPSGLGYGSVVASFADLIYVILTPDTAGLRGADKLISALGKECKDKIRLLINKIHPVYIKAAVQLKPEEISDMLPQSIDGVFPYSYEIYSAMNLAELPVDKGGRLGQGYKNLVYTILGRNVASFDWRKAAKSKL